MVLVLETNVNLVSWQVFKMISRLTPSSFLVSTGFEAGLGASSSSSSEELDVQISRERKIMKIK